MECMLPKAVIDSPLDFNYKVWSAHLGPPTFIAFQRGLLDITDCQDTILHTIANTQAWHFHRYLAWVRLFAWKCVQAHCMQVDTCQHTCMHVQFLHWHQTSYLRKEAVTGDCWMILGLPLFLASVYPAVIHISP